MNYKKYIKYKTKYTDLKNQNGGAACSICEFEIQLLITFTHDSVKGLEGIIVKEDIVYARVDLSNYSNGSRNTVFKRSLTLKEEYKDTYKILTLYVTATISRTNGLITKYYINSSTLDTLIQNYELNNFLLNPILINTEFILSLLNKFQNEKKCEAYILEKKASLYYKLV